MAEPILTTGVVRDTWVISAGLRPTDYVEVNAGLRSNFRGQPGKTFSFRPRSPIEPAYRSRKPSACRNAGSDPFKATNSRRLRPTHGDIDRINRTRRRDKQPVALGPAEGEVGDGLRYADLANQFARRVEAMHAIGGTRP